MKLTQKELNHLIFLSEVVITGKKKGLMDETLQCLLYIVKSLEEVDLPDNVVDQIERLTAMIEEDLRNENERMQEINSHLDWLQRGQRKPLG
jgi:Asp-tRNA(Asn)/Glu-tRNA(Gln) amidotransferase C subunit